MPVMMTLDSSKFLNDREDFELQELLRRQDGEVFLVFKILRLYGMRVNELLSVRPRDLNHSNRSMLIHGSKGSMNRELPLSDEVYDKLMFMCKQCVNDDMTIFSVKYHQVQYVWERYGPRRKTLHSLRHTVGVEVYRRTKDIHFVKALLGHRNIANTMIYLEFSRSQEEFRRVLL